MIDHEQQNMRMFKPGQAIVREGEVGDKMYVIHAGRVRIEKDMNGGPKVIAELEAGAFFGEMSLLTQSPRHATASAVTEVKALELDWQTFSKRLGQYRSVAVHMIKTLIHRLEDTLQLVEQLYQRNASERVVRSLLRESLGASTDDADMSAMVHIGAESLCDSTGLGWQQVSSVLTSLRSERFIELLELSETSDMQLVVPSTSKLEHFLRRLEVLEEMP